MDRPRFKLDDLRQATFNFNFHDSSGTVTLPTRLVDVHAFKINYVRWDTFFPGDADGTYPKGMNFHSKDLSTMRESYCNQQDPGDNHVLAPMEAIDVYCSANTVNDRFNVNCSEPFHFYKNGFEIPVMRTQKTVVEKFDYQFTWIPWLNSQTFSNISTGGNVWYKPYNTLSVGFYEVFASAVPGFSWKDQVNGILNITFYYE